MAEINVDSIIEKSVNLFFPNNESKLGFRHEFNFRLQDQEGNFLSKFTDRNGSICKFDKWLEQSGIYKSQLKFILLSQEDEKVKQSTEVIISSESSGQEDEIIPQL